MRRALKSVRLTCRFLDAPSGWGWNEGGGLLQECGLSGDTSLSGQLPSLLGEEIWDLRSWDLALPPPGSSRIGTAKRGKAGGLGKLRLPPPQLSRPRSPGSRTCKGSAPAVATAWTPENPVWI